MRPTVWLLVLVGFAGSLVAQTRPAPQQTGTARIRGTVVDATAGTPLRRASLRLRTTPSTRESWTAVTDGNGSFEFPALPSGRFTIAVSKGGYVNFNTPADATRSIQLTDGQTLDLPPLRLPRGGVITGSIRDEYGDGAPEIAVEAYRAEYMQGIRRLISARSGKTDDIGRYRIYGLQPGTYYVAASARGENGSPLQFMEPGTDAVPGAAGLAPTFYPGTATAADAQRIQVAAGAESTGVDFGLSPVRLARLTGVVIDARAKPATAYAVMLNPARSDGALLGGSIVAETDANGRFTLGNVAPGDYRMDVYARAFFERIAQSGSTGKAKAAETWEFASVPITVAGEDVAGLSIKLTAGHSMSGRVSIEGAPPNSQALSSMGISAMEPIGGTSGTLLAAHTSLQEGGTFRIGGLIGRRIVRLSGLPRGWALKAVRVRGVDVTDDGLEISDNVEDVEIVVTTTPTHLTGVVTDSAGQLVAGGSVIIFPEARERRGGPLNRFVTSARVDGNGAFTLQALPPGRYFGIAVAELADGEWADPAYLETLEVRAVRFTLSEGESKQIGLRLDSK